MSDVISCISITSTGAMLEKKDQGRYKKALQGLFITVQGHDNILVNGKFLFRCAGLRALQRGDGGDNGSHEQWDEWS